MMDEGAVNAIAALAQMAKADDLRIVTVADREWSTVPLHAIQTPAIPEPRALTVSTLTGIRDYLESALDADGSFPNVALHVAGPERVDLVTAIVPDSRQQRFTLVSAQLHDRLSGGRFNWGAYIVREEMSVALLSLFVQGVGSIAKVQLLVGNVQDASLRTERDDGVTQTVTARAAVGVLVDVKVPNPVSLAPFRTFPEVEQPTSLFTFRLKKNDSTGEVRAALFEADGGAWRQVAIANIADWLRREVPAVPVIA